MLALLARTDPDPSQGARGLSLFIVPKDRFDGHDFEMKQPGGGRLVGKADATPGYRGMHSFTLNFEDYSVPGANLVGGDAGIGRGFYLQMAGFAAGRLQTGGRACGLAQAALEKTAEYVVDRVQFGQPISEFQLTQYTLGRMAAMLASSRAITYAAARAMDEDERAAAPLAAQAKLLACDMAVELTQHGPAAARRLGLRRGVPDQPLRRRRAGAADLRGREADPRAQGGRAGACSAASARG